MLSPTRSDVLNHEIAVVPPLQSCIQAETDHDFMPETNTLVGYVNIVLDFASVKNQIHRLEPRQTLRTLI